MRKQQALQSTFTRHTAPSAASAQQAVRQLLLVTARYWEVRELRTGMPALQVAGWGMR